MSHSRVSLGRHCNSLHHERCGKAASGTEVGRCVQGPRPAPACRARLSAGACFSARHLPTLAFSSGPSNKSFVEPGPRRRETRTPVLKALPAGTPRLWKAESRGGITPGAPRAPQAARSRSPHGSSLPCTCERANRSAPSKPAPGWRPLLDLNRPRLLSFTFESHDWYLYGGRGARLGSTCPLPSGQREERRRGRRRGLGSARGQPPKPRRAGLEAANVPLSVCPWHPTATAGPLPPSPVPPPPAPGSVRNEGRRRAPPRTARAASAASATTGARRQRRLAALLNPRAHLHGPAPR